MQIEELLQAELLENFKSFGFESFTAIQNETIPVLMNNKDLIAQAKTGSGKTAAFALPILERIDLAHKAPQALIICPTRELTQQVTGEFRKLGRVLQGLQVLSLVGGQPAREQSEALAQGVHVVVGTPGRVLDLIRRQRFDVSDIKILILDEADKMLELGFLKEVQDLIQTLPEYRQTGMFSATFPPEILNLSKRFQKQPQKIVIREEDDFSSIEQFVYEAEEEHKLETLMRVLQQHPAESSIVFFNKKSAIEAVSSHLEKQKVPWAALHGDLDQKERDRVLTLFRNNSYRILLATDIAARGLDIKNLDLVINYDLPPLVETYIHRIGRTGRAGAQGTAVTISDPKDTLRIVALEDEMAVRFVRQNLGFKNQFGLAKTFKELSMQTIEISGGRKDKIRAGDILGALTSEGSGVSGDQIGKIEIHDKQSFVAISATYAQRALQHLKTAKIKGQRFYVKIL